MSSTYAGVQGRLDLIREACDLVGIERADGSQPVDQLRRFLDVMVLLEHRDTATPATDPWGPVQAQLGPDPQADDPEVQAAADRLTGDLARAEAPDLQVTVQADTGRVEAELARGVANARRRLEDGQPGPRSLRMIVHPADPAAGQPGELAHTPAVDCARCRTVQLAPNPTPPRPPRHVFQPGENVLADAIASLQRHAAEQHARAASAELSAASLQAIADADAADAELLDALGDALASAGDAGDLEQHLQDQAGQVSEQ